MAGSRDALPEGKPPRGVTFGEQNGSFLARTEAVVPQPGPASSWRAAVAHAGCLLLGRDCATIVPAGYRIGKCGQHG